MLKKEDIYVKLTKKNVLKVVKTLNRYKQEYYTRYTGNSPQYVISKFGKIYLFYMTDSKEWYISAIEPQNKTLIKPKQLKELLENERLYNSYYLYNPFWEGNPLWEATKGGIGDKGMEYDPKSKPLVKGSWTIEGDEIISEIITEPNKQLEIGKWYKYQGFDHKGNDMQVMFLFNGTKGNEGKTIGFDNNGEYCDNISIYYASVEIFQEAKPEEVIEAFIYHMENFADKNRNV